MKSVPVPLSLRMLPSLFTSHVSRFRLPCVPTMQTSTSESFRANVFAMPPMILSFAFGNTFWTILSRRWHSLVFRRRSDSDGVIAARIPCTYLSISSAPWRLTGGISCATGAPDSWVLSPQRRVEAKWTDSSTRESSFTEDLATSKFLSLSFDVRGPGNAVDQESGGCFLPR